MTNLKSLTDAELEFRITEAKAELQRREDASKPTPQRSYTFLKSGILWANLDDKYKDALDCGAIFPPPKGTDTVGLDDDGNLCAWDHREATVGIWNGLMWEAPEV